jgi:hypothetical protein
MKTLGRDAGLLLVGLFVTLSIQDAFPRESDTQKWERLQKNKEMRRAIEAKYEACVNHCSRSCK